MKKLDHPNIMKLHGVYESDNSIYVMLEVMEGGPFSLFVKQKGKIDENEALVYLKHLL